MPAPIDERIPKNEIEALFRRQRECASRISDSDYRQRKEKLERMLAYLTTHSLSLEKALYDDLKKPAAEARLSEVITLTSELRYHLRHLKRWMTPQAVSTPFLATGTRSYIRYEPKGTSLIISPWNYPVSLAIKPLISAVSAGCTAIIKPSEYTPNASSFLRSFVHNLFPSEEVNVIEGGPEVAADLLEQPFDHIFFTGSPGVGKIVMGAAAKHLTSVSLELGGKSPSIVDETADISKTARLIAWAKFLNNGQTCISPDYVLIHESVKVSFLHEIKKALQAMYNPEGKGVKSSSDYGRLIHLRQFERLESLYQNAVTLGAGTICGGNFERKDLFMEPTVLSDASTSMAIMQEEIFGPLLPVISYSSREEALSVIHSLDKPLALYIHSRSPRNIDFFLSKTSSGNALINEMLMQFQHAEIPFGGIKNSGMGKANGFFGFQSFSNPKGVIKRQFGSASFLFPPFNATKEKFMDFVKRYL